jgi:hypothetical protein
VELTNLQKYLTFQFNCGYSLGMTYVNIFTAARQRPGNQVVSSRGAHLCQAFLSFPTCP